MPVSELLDRTSALELAEWKAYERDTGTLGQQRDDQLAAMTAYYVVSALGAKKVKMRDMVPVWGRRRGDSHEVLSAKLRAATLAMGGQIVEAPTG